MLNAITITIFIYTQLHEDATYFTHYNLWSSTSVTIRLTINNT